MMYNALAIILLAKTVPVPDLLPDLLPGPLPESGAVGMAGTR
jgi:hypothetical protein